MPKPSFPRKSLLKRSLKKFTYFVDEVVPELPGLEKKHARALGSLLFNPFPARRLKALNILAKYKQPISVDVLINSLRFETDSNVKSSILRAMTYHFRTTPGLLKAQLPWLQRRLTKEEDDLSRHNLLTAFSSLHYHGLISHEELAEIFLTALKKETNSSIRDGVFNLLSDESFADLQKLSEYRRNPKSKPSVIPQTHLAYFPVYARMLEDQNPEVRKYVRIKLKRLIDSAKFYSPHAGPGEPARVFRHLNGGLTSEALMEAHKKTLEELEAFYKQSKTR